MKRFFAWIACDRYYFCRFPDEGAPVLWGPYSSGTFSIRAKWIQLRSKHKYINRRKFTPNLITHSLNVQLIVEIKCDNELVGHVCIVIWAWDRSCASFSEIVRSHPDRRLNKFWPVFELEPSYGWTSLLSPIIYECFHCVNLWWWQLGITLTCQYIHLSWLLVLCIGI